MLFSEFLASFLITVNKNNFFEYYGIFKFVFWLQIIYHCAYGILELCFLCPFKSSKSLVSWPIQNWEWRFIAQRLQRREMQEEEILDSEIWSGTIENSDQGQLATVMQGNALPEQARTNHQAEARSDVIICKKITLFARSAKQGPRYRNVEIANTKTTNNNGAWFISKVWYEQV